MAKAKVSRLQETKKSDQPEVQQAIDREREHRLNVEELAEKLVYILTNPACPDKLHSAITDALSEIETHTETVSVDFLRGSSFHHRGRLRANREVNHGPPDQNKGWAYEKF